MNETPRRFVWCTRVLAAAGAASIVVGLVLVLATGTPLFTAYDRSVARAFYETEGLPASSVQHHHWLLGVIGSSTVGWGVTFLAIVVGPFRRRELWAWNVLVLSVGIWAALDLMVSVVHGVGAELAVVGTVLAVVALPLAVSRSYFTDGT